MKKLFFLLTLPLAAQVNFTLACPANARGTTTCTININGNPVATQGTISITAGATSIPWTITTTIPNKGISSAASTGNFVISGMNQTVIPNGLMGTITFTMPASGVQVALTSPFAANPAGDPLTVTVNPPVAVALQSNCDINGDGLVNSADVDTINLTILNNPPNPSFNVSHKQKVINATLPGGACTL